MCCMFFCRGHGDSWNYCVSRRLHMHNAQLAKTKELPAAFANRSSLFRAAHATLLYKLMAAFVTVQQPHVKWDWDCVRASMYPSKRRLGRLFSFSWTGLISKQYNIV